MDFKLAASIYRTAWLVEAKSAIKLVEMLEEVKAGKANYAKKPSSRLEFFQSRSEVITAPIDRWAAKDHPGYEGKAIGVLPINGALMKEDFCGWFGTASLRNELAKMDRTESLKTIVLLIDSPGGTVDGTEALADAIKNSSKEIIAVIDGMMCSAAYWIGSSAKRIIATSKTDIIGSIGTMMSITDRSDYMEEMGIVVREYYADASKDKNRIFTEARDGKNDGRLLIEQLLNPLNDIFLDAVKTNRGEALNQKETLTGKTFLAADALKLGLIDEIGSFDTTIQNLLQKHNTSITMKIKSTFKNILSFLNIKAAEGSETVELKDEQLAQVEAALPDLATTKEKVTQLETAATADKDKITALEAQVAALTTERDALQKSNGDLKAEVEKLGNMDGSKITGAKSEGSDKFTDDKVDAADMDFQKDLYNKL